MSSHTHHGALAHQFEDLTQQREVASLGMWLFLVTEILFFGGLFLVYSVYRSWYPAAFTAGSHELLVWAGTTNTVVLITSSLTMALAVHAAETGNRRALILLLLATMALGCVFLGIKSYEYWTEYIEHHIPAHGFEFQKEYFFQAQIFFSLYFVMTGLHALHMIIGLGIMSVMVWMSWRGKITPEYPNPIEVSGLYWHFVDIVWIFLFPLLYLIGRHVH
ncbi:MAG TPA: cytochrome c oxidase subunit 3 family protein [Vicinamibacterales bacterium]|nr:cytochrome c oxidase subunit 3 family protein [Vicinamibacterales bacterium]